jgi:hypothetical protein
MVDLFILEDAPEAFHRGVVIAISFPAHGRPHPTPIKQQGIFLGAILTPSIRVMNQTRCRSLGGYGPQEGLANQVLRHALCHGIPYDFSGKKILMAGKIQPAFPCGNVSDIA